MRFKTDLSGISDARKLELIGEINEYLDNESARLDEENMHPGSAKFMEHIGRRAIVSELAWMFARAEAEP